MGKEFGVITEQGFPVGQFGFDKLNEQDNTTITKEDESKNTIKQTK